MSVKWRKSSYSYQTNCVEVAGQNGVILLRDSKAPDGPVLSFAPDDWRRALEFLTR